MTLMPPPWWAAPRGAVPRRAAWRRSRAGAAGDCARRARREGPAARSRRCCPPHAERPPQRLVLRRVPHATTASGAYAFVCKRSRAAGARRANRGLARPRGPRRSGLVRAPSDDRAHGLARPLRPGAPVPRPAGRSVPPPASPSAG